MDDLLQLQIRESCKLALPNGLSELMYDISREVLRAQPTNLCEFIANYLSALLVTRENLKVASKVCDNVCENLCHLGLEGDLINIGLCEEDVQVVKEVIQVYFAKEHVSEANIIKELFAKTDITEDQIESVQEAIQTAFKRYQATTTTVFESTSSESEMSDSTRAARHTVKLYRTTKPTEQEYEKAAGSIQAAYRAYGVRRRRDMNRRIDSALPDDIAEGRPTKSLRFGSDDDLCSRSTYTGSQTDITSNVTEKTEDIFVSQSAYKPAHLATVSSTSLAGSLVLPSNKPYSVHDTLQEENEIDFPEKEHSNVDYTLLDSDKMDPCKSTEFIEDNVTCAEDSEVSIEEDVDLIEMSKMKHLYKIDENFETVAETEVEEYHTHIVDEDDDDTIAGDSSIESDHNSAQVEDNIDAVKNKKTNDASAYDGGEIISNEGDSYVSENEYIILENLEEEDMTLPEEDIISPEENLQSDSVRKGKNEIDRLTPGERDKASKKDEYIGSVLEIKEDIEDIVLESHGQSDKNAIPNKVGRNDDEHVDSVESIEKDANHVIKKTLSQTHDSIKSNVTKSHIEINPEVSQQYFLDENDSEIIALEKSTVPKTPFHSVTNFDDDDEDEVPEL